MPDARIYRPAKNAMQSGRGRSEQWVLEYSPEAAKAPESLMGWTSSADTQEQVRLRFDSLEDARRYAESHGITASIELPHERKLRPRNYGDNFRYHPAGAKS